MGNRIDEGVIAEAHAAACAVWPRVVVSRADFAAWVEARLADDDSLEALRTSDLYLACACASGDAHAIALFEQHMLAEVDGALHKLAIPSAAIDDTKQVLRRRFFVAENGKAPRIADYAGRGSLKSWVRAGAVRAALRVIRRPKGQVDVESAVMRAVPAQGDDLELDYLKRRYQTEFEAALRESFAALPTRDRNVVRYYFAEGLSIDALGVLYGVHRATAARWVKRTTDVLMTKTRAVLTARLGAHKSEVSSIVRMLASQLDMAVRAVLADDKTV